MKPQAKKRIRPLFGSQEFREQFEKLLSGEKGDGGEAPAPVEEHEEREGETT